MSVLQNILAKYRKTSFSQRDKGARFERLMQAFLRTAPMYAGEIAQVWLWEEFHNRGQFGGQRYRHRPGGPDAGRRVLGGAVQVLC